MNRTKTQSLPWELVLWVAVGFLALALIAAIASTAGGAGAASPKQPPFEQRAWILSPIQGTFLAGEYPGCVPFVCVGTKVKPETVVCQLIGAEAVKLPAQLTGTVVEVLVADGQAVAAGQPLFVVRLAESAKLPR